MGLAIQCDCGEEVPFFGDGTLPDERECRGCGTVYVLRVTKKLKDEGDQND
jgi:hypothetical protein